MMPQWTSAWHAGRVLGYGPKRAGSLLRAAKARGCWQHVEWATVAAELAGWDDSSPWPFAPVNETPVVLCEGPDTKRANRLAALDHFDDRNDLPPAEDEKPCRQCGQARPRDATYCRTCAAKRKRESDRRAQRRKRAKQRAGLSEKSVFSGE